MFELVKVTEKTYYINYPTQIGIHLVSDDEVVLIDSGNDARAGKLVLKTLNKNGWRLKAIYNTHCHSDHVGGNAFLQRETGCKVYVPEIDRAAVCFPFLNQMLLAGAYPAKALDQKLFLAEASDALTLTEDVLPDGFEIIPLKGHTMGMVGFKTPDGVAFLADSVVSEATLAKYFVTYIISPADYLNTLEKLREINAKVFLPSHVHPTEDINELVDKNRAAVEKIADTLLEFFAAPHTAEEAVQHIFNVSGMYFSVADYYMVGSTVHSFTAYLEREGKIKPVCSENRVFWQALPIAE